MYDDEDYLMLIKVKAFKVPDDWLMNSIPPWVIKAFEDSTLYRHQGKLILQAVAGNKIVSEGDWLVLTSANYIVAHIDKDFKNLFVKIKELNFEYTN